MKIVKLKIKNLSKGPGLSLSKGFTLIELLVVIAIIGILSSVVLTALNNARSRGQNAKIKSQLSGVRAAAELYYGVNSYYGSAIVSGTNCATVASTMLSDTTVRQYLDAMTTTGECWVTTGANGAYSIGYDLSSVEGANASWCVDSAGKSKAIANLAALTGVTCP